MATSSFFSSFSFVDPEAEKKFYEEIQKAIDNLPERVHSKLKFSPEDELRAIKVIKDKMKAESE